jgi:hypothetical protein
MSKAASVTFFCIALSPAMFAQNYTCDVFAAPGYLGQLSLNNAGQLVTSTNSQGYLRQRDGTVVTFAYPGADNTRATYINNNGQILGSFYDPSSQGNRTFLRFPDGSFQLVTSATEDDTPAGLTAVNDNLDLGGTIHANPGYLEGYEDVVVQDTSGNLLSRTRMPGSHDNVVTRTVTALNNSRDWVAFNASGGFFAPITFVSYRSQQIAVQFPGVVGNYQGSDFATFATGLNNAGVIAGYWRAGAGYFGFVHQLDATAYPAVSCEGWDAALGQMQPAAINDHGQIAGTMTTDSGAQVFIATPTGTAPDLYLSNNSWTFSSTQVGATTGAGTIYITNRGTGMLHIANAARLDAMLFGDDASDFKITGTTCPPSLGINHTCSISFNFTPSAMGNRTANIVLADNSPTGPHIIPIQGMGAGTTLEIATPSAQFPALPVGQTSGNIVIYPYANGNQPVHFSIIGITGLNASDFSIASNTCGTLLQPYTTCAVAVRFHPSAAGYRWGTLVFDGDLTRQVGLFGNGY